MKFASLLLAALTLSVLTARAEETPANPPPPPAPVGENQNPSSPAPAPDPKGRKEDDEEEKRGGLFDSLFGKKAKKDADKAKKEAADATSRLATLEAENERLKAENEQYLKKENAFNAEWPAIEAAILAGDDKAEALQTDFGQRVATAVNKAVTRAHARSGHDPKNLPGPGADKPKASAGAPDPDKPKTAATHFGGHWQERGWSQPGLS